MTRLLLLLLVVALVRGERCVPGGALTSCTPSVDDVECTSCGNGNGSCALAYHGSPGVYCGETRLYEQSMSVCCPRPFAGDVVRPACLLLRQQAPRQGVRAWSCVDVEKADMWLQDGEDKVNLWLMFMVGTGFGATLLFALTIIGSWWDKYACCVRRSKINRHAAASYSGDESSSCLLLERSVDEPASDPLSASGWRPLL